jgi:hypothetical protein
MLAFRLPALLAQALVLELLARQLVRLALVLALLVERLLLDPASAAQLVQLALLA